jgi:hypothetical protein
MLKMGGVQGHCLDVGLSISTLESEQPEWQACLWRLYKIGYNYLYSVFTFS